MAGDLSYAVRSLSRSPGFTIAAILTLSIGIGATTAIYSVVETILLRPLQVLRLIMRQGLGLAAIGVALGIVAAAAAARSLQSMLFGIGALDPVTFAAVAIGFTAVSLLASYVPARRATAVEPVVALRHE